VARLDDGTIAGSVLTMDRAFAVLVTVCGLGLVEAAILCATTPARQLNLQGFGVISPGFAADLVVLDPNLRVVQTWLGGARIWPLS
jgi:N-acetylglucosamine-6-phosphate deacetylase